MSKHLNDRQLRGLEKLGDVFVPGVHGLPSFSASRCASDSNRADRILDQMSKSDLNDVKLLLSLMSLFPQFLVIAFIALLELSLRMPASIGAPLRIIRLGVRGLILTLYYSQPEAHRTLGFEVGVYTDDLKQAQPNDCPNPR